MKTLLNKYAFCLFMLAFMLPLNMQSQCDWPVVTATEGVNFVNPIQPMPPLITRPDYHLIVDEALHNFDPNTPNSPLNRFVPTFAFNEIGNQFMTILGPTISWQFGSTIEAKVTNELIRETTTHWHGAHVPVKWDGGPHQRIYPGTTWEPTFEVKDKSATMWYHPHAMDLTYSQVQMGLSGMIYVEDPVGVDPVLSRIHDMIPHTYGVDDFPLIVQTKQFRRNPLGNVEIYENFGYDSDYMHLINGTMNPYIEVPQNLVRFRVLNGDGKYSFDLGIVDKDTTYTGFQFIATDAGYTDKSYAMDKVLMAPGERTEWLVDFRNYNVGDTLFLYNKVEDMVSGIIGRRDVSMRLLKIVVVPNALVPTSPLTFPVDLHPSEAPPLSEVDNTRLKTFRKDPFNFNPPLTNCNRQGVIESVSRRNTFNIDSTLMNMMVVNDVVNLGDTEVWTINNTTTIAHPWHIHDIHFWVTELVITRDTTIKDTMMVDGRDTVIMRTEFLRRDTVTWDDVPDSLAYMFKGPKDNVLVQKNWQVSYITTFDDYGTSIAPQNSYMYHCHILPHEDRGMMGQFVVWDGTVNTEELALTEQQMKVYPNPSDGLLYLEGSSREESLVRVLDIQGRVLREALLAPFEGAVPLNLEGLSSGVVFIQWMTNEGRATRKVILD